MFGLGMQELVIVGIVAVLLFGKRLPEVARSMGKSYNEFRKGLNDIQTSIDYNDTGSSRSYGSQSSSSAYDDYDESDEPTAPKFEPPVSEPTGEGMEAQLDAGDATETANEMGDVPGESGGAGGAGESASGGDSVDGDDEGQERGGNLG